LIDSSPSSDPSDSPSHSSASSSNSSEDLGVDSSVSEGTAVTVEGAGISPEVLVPEVVEIIAEAENTNVNKLNPYPRSSSEVTVLDEDYVCAEPPIIARARKMIIINTWPEMKAEFTVSKYICL
jgi:hypothetical protein